MGFYFPKNVFQYSLIISICVLFLASPVLAGLTTVGFLTGSGGLGDESFNDMTYAGLGKARETLGFKIEVRQWEPNLSMETLLLELIEAKPDIVILNGDQFLPLVEKYAHQYSDINFIANDFDGGDHPNVKSIIYSQHEGSFLAGALAGSLTKTHRIGFIGAINIDVIKAFQTGFIQGIKHVSPTTEIEVAYISKLPDFTGFNNPQEGNRLATSLYRKGVDIIFAVAGLSGNGIIQAAKTSNKFVIGVDSNQDHMAKGLVLTSVMKRLDTAIFTEVIKAFTEDMAPGIVWYGLENGGISLTPMRYTQDIIPQKIRMRIQTLKAQIISGEISVTNILNKSETALPKAGDQ